MHILIILPLVVMAKTDIVSKMMLYILNFWRDFLSFTFEKKTRDLSVGRSQTGGRPSPGVDEVITVISQIVFAFF